jgi:hypothetical protein
VPLNARCALRDGCARRLPHARRRAPCARAVALRERASLELPSGGARAAPMPLPMLREREALALRVRIHDASRGCAFGFAAVFSPVLLHKRKRRLSHDADGVCLTTPGKATP